MRKQMREAIRIVESMAGCSQYEAGQAISHLALLPGEVVEITALIRRLCEVDNV